MRFGIRRCSDWQQTSWNSKTLVTHTSLGFCKDPVTYVEMLYEQKVSKYKVLHSPAWEKFLGQKLQGSEMIMIVEDDRICPEGELERGRSISDTIYLTVVMSKHSQSVGGLCGWRKEKGHLDWDNLGLRTKWDKTWDAWPNTWHTERQQLAQAITMISMCQAHLPQVFRALSTGLSSSFFIGDLNKWGCQLSEQQLEETGDSLTPGLDYFLYTVDSSHISFTLKKEKKQTVDQDGLFFLESKDIRSIRGRKSGYLQHPQKCYLEKEMAVHSRILAWRIPQSEEPGGFMSLKESGMTWWVNNSYIKFRQPVKRKERSATLFDICPFCSHCDAW